MEADYNGLSVEQLISLLHERDKKIQQLETEICRLTLQIPSTEIQSVTDSLTIPDISGLLEQIDEAAERVNNLGVDSPKEDPLQTKKTSHKRKSLPPGVLTPLSVPFDPGQQPLIPSRAKRSLSASSGVIPRTLVTPIALPLVRVEAPSVTTPENAEPSGHPLKKFVPCASIFSVPAATRATGERRLSFSPLPRGTLFPLHQQNPIPERQPSPTLHNPAAQPTVTSNLLPVAEKHESTPVQPQGPVPFSLTHLKTSNPDASPALTTLQPPPAQSPALRRLSGGTNLTRFQSQPITAVTHPPILVPTSASASCLPQPAQRYQPAPAPQRNSNRMSYIAKPASLVHFSDTQMQAISEEKKHQQQQIEQGDPSSLPLQTPKSAADSLIAQMEKRNYTLLELKDSTISYGTSMEVLQEVFLEPLQSQQIVSNEEYQFMFGSTIQGILNTAVEAKNQTIQMFDQNYDPDLASMLLQLVGDFRTTSAWFVSNLDAINAKIKELSKSNPKFGKFLRDSSRNPRCNGSDIMDFLIKPVQRIPQYEMLLSDLLKRTTTDHPHYHSIEQALEEFQKAGFYINETKRKKEETDKVLAIEELLSTPKQKVDLWSPGRKVVLQGEFLCFEDKKTSKDYMLFLFTDLLVIAVLEEKKPREKKRIQSKDIQLVVDSDFQNSEPLKSHKFKMPANFDQTLGFVVVEAGAAKGEALHVFVPKNKNQRSDWLKQLKEVQTKAYILPSSLK